MQGVRTLKDVDLTLALEGAEGLDVNYASRIRTQYLFSQHQSLITQTQFADAKAAALMALLGLLVLRGPVDLTGSVDVQWFRILYLGCVSLAFFFCLLSIFPRYPSGEERIRIAKVDRWTWCSLASDTLSDGKFGEFMQTSEVSQLIYSVASANCTIASILLSKYRSLRFAFIFTVVVLLLVGGYLVFLPMAKSP